MKGKKTGGRKAGTPNKVNADIKALASQYDAEAIGILLSIARTSTSDAARVAAIKELFDRGHGKPAQAVTGADGDGPVKMTMTVVHELHPKKDDHDA